MTDPLDLRPINRRVTLMVVGASVGVGLLDVAQWQLGAEFRGESPPLWYAFGTQLLPWVWLALLVPAVIVIAGKWPLDQGRWRRNLPIHVIAMAVFALLQVAGAVTIAGYFARQQPVEYKFLWTKLLLFRFPINAMAYWAAVGAAHGARAAAMAREREQTAARLEASLTEARLASLRDRLNPHFLFNTLNAVTTQALRQDHRGVIRTVEALSDLLRMTLDEQKGQLGTVTTELAFLDRYLEIERLRIGDRLALGRDVGTETLGAEVPAMLLQPLVENAIRHGISVKPGPGRVDLRIKRDQDTLVIEVADTGPGFPAKPGRSSGLGIGLDHSRARLSALYGARASLDCHNAENGGGIVTVCLPFTMGPAAR